MQDIEIIMKEREGVKSYSPIRCCNLYHAEKEVVEKNQDTSLLYCNIWHVYSLFGETMNRSRRIVLW